MSEIAVKVVEPGGHATAQLVPDAVRCSALIESLIRVLELPGQLTYELVPTKTREAIPKKRTLRKADDTLRLEVIRNAWFRKLLDKLFDEATDYLRDELIDMARRRLETIERLDPGYPDLDLLRQGVDHAPSGKRPGRRGRPAAEEVIVVEGAPPTTPIPPYRPPTVGGPGGGVAATVANSRVNSATMAPGIISPSGG
ncbi:MAG: hypothetical protein ACYS22_14565 [Planctomycetota bacterium]|jgi:hypothetical protein